MIHSKIKISTLKGNKYFPEYDLRQVEKLFADDEEVGDGAVR